MKYISLFAGIGGFDLALNRLGHECVWANEWNKYASKIYRKQLGEVDTRDITTVPTGEIPDHDLLVGGFPCQAFSIAGKRRGFDDTRGTLFFEIARILKDKQPKFFILENVKGLLSHDNGFTFKTIISTLTELGYDLQWQVLNSKNFGVPQNRERVFIVGHIRGQPRPEVFPIRKSTGLSTESSGQGEVENRIAPAVTSNLKRGVHSGGEAYIAQLNHPRHSNNRIYNPDGLAPTLHLKTGGWQEPKVAIPVLTPDRPIKRQNGRRFKEDGEPSFTLTGQDKHGVSDGMRIRRLTPTECERLQGFPDGFTEGVSDTQRYKCLGNAVSVPVVEAIARRLNG